MPTVSRRTWFMGGAALVVLLAFYLPALQTIPNGSEHYYMIDVGETQIVLNTWGTLHATGYPLFVMAGNILVTLLRGLGVAAVTAPAVVALVWGLAALALLYALAVHLTGRPALAAGMVILLGLTRTVWIHHVIAEIYTFGLLLLAALLLLALWKAPVRGRVYWLALVGGIAVFHHRALLMAAPALVFAVWREIFPTASASAGKRYWMVIRTLVIALFIGLLGFLPYAYLPLRASAGAEWVYGQPGSWTGFWDQFTGREAERFIGAPNSPEGLLANFSTVNTVLLTDLTLPGLAVGILGLVLALRNPTRRRAALVFLLNGGAAYTFHVLLYTDVLSALILPVLVSVAFGWLFLAEMVLSLPVHLHHASGRPHRADPTSQKDYVGTRHAVSAGQYASSTIPGTHSGAPKPFISRSIDWLYGQTDPHELPASDRNRILIRVWGTGAVILAGLLLGAVLRWQNQPFIAGLTSDPTGLDTIRLAQSAPTGSTLMFAWGPRYFAASFAQDVAGTLPDIHLVDHRGDFAAILQTGSLLTPDYTFYNQPVSWWEERIGARVYLHAAAPHLVQIATQPETAAGLPDGITMLEQSATCEDDRIILRVAWGTGSQPQQDWSVFVHLLDASGTVVSQGDQSAPVYGWRPLTTWEAGEVVRDVYILPRVAGAPRLRYGMYHQLADGEFINESEYDLALTCNAS